MTDKRPNYYRVKSGHDVFDAARDFGLDPQATCALKYLVRAGKKTADPREDLRKAIVCIERMVEFWEQDNAAAEDIKHHGCTLAEHDPATCEWCLRGSEYVGEP